MRRTMSLRDGWQIHALRGHGRLAARTLRELARPDSPRFRDWLPARLPSQVQDVLLRHGRIPDPREPGRARECLWVWEKDWVYRGAFARPRQGGRVWLHAKGLDTLADVYLNGQHVASHADQCLPLRVEITDALAERNTILLHFHSAPAHVRKLAVPQGWDARIKRERLLRKSPEDFGPFLGANPCFTHVGVYDDVCLDVSDGATIDALNVDTRLGPGYRRAWVDVSLAGEGRGAGEALEVTVADPRGRVVARRVLSLSRGGRGGWTARGRIDVPDPERWWPRGYGGQPLYTVEATLSRDGITADAAARRVGFRDVRIDARFDLRVNGHRVKLWGANLVPLDGMTYVWNPERCRVLLDLAENAHMNTLRVWGPGEPFHDTLFDECDRRGILVWHEFQHTWGPYPDAAEYRARCRRAAEQIVRRRRHHPCILLWCGANETQMGCEAAGWPSHDYPGRVLFERDYRRVCRRLDPQRFYYSTSPTGGGYANDPRAGDSHSYTHQSFVPGAQYPVLFTEHTRNAPPLIKSLRRMLGPRLWPRGGSAGHPGRFSDTPLPPAWMAVAKPHAFIYGPGCEPWDFPDFGDSAEGLTRRYSAACARYIRENVERLRRGRPSEDAPGPRRCMGQYWWKLNSAWPEIYSELVDYYLEPKAIYYAMRRAYQPLLVSLEIGDHVMAWVINDTAEDVRGTLILALLDVTSGRALKEVRAPVRVSAGDSAPVMRGDAFGMFLRQHAIVARLVDVRGRDLACAVDFAKAERHLAFPAATIRMGAAAGVLTLRSETFARCVELSGHGFGWRFEDNFFDLLPGETKRVRVLGAHRAGVVTAQSWYSPHAARVEATARDSG